MIKNNNKIIQNIMKNNNNRIIKNIIIKNNNIN